jgi:hypothetical protein
MTRLALTGLDVRWGGKGLFSGVVGATKGVQACLTGTGLPGAGNRFSSTARETAQGATA